jgi:hypothetical protein
MILDFALLHAITENKRRIERKQHRNRAISLHNAWDEEIKTLESETKMLMSVITQKVRANLPRR